MAAKEIHDNLLSLFLRGLGVWLLYLALSSDRFIRVFDSLFSVFSTLGASNPDVHFDWESLFLEVIQLLAAAYFILGAPPFLKWATSSKATKE